TPPVSPPSVPGAGAGAGTGVGAGGAPGAEVEVEPGPRSDDSRLCDDTTFTRAPRRARKTRRATIRRAPIINATSLSQPAGSDAPVRRDDSNRSYLQYSRFIAQGSGCGIRNVRC